MLKPMDTKAKSVYTNIEDNSRRRSVMGASRLIEGAISID